MSTPDPDVDTKFYNLTINKYYVLGYTVMLLYDHVLTLDGEIDLIWRRRFTFPTYVFMIFRYLTPLVCILTIAAEHDPTWTGTRCSRWIWLPAAIGPIISATTGIILILRTHALYNRALWVLYIIVPIYLAQIAIMGWSIPAGVPAQLPAGFVGCIPSERDGTINRLTASYIAALVLDSVIFILTFARAVYLRLLSARIPLVSLLLRDGTMYFFAMFIVNLVNVFVLLDASLGIGAMNARLSNLMIATLVARLMINLRANGRRTQSNIHTSTSSTSRVSTIAAIETWFSVPNSISEGVFGMSEFDPPVGEWYGSRASGGTVTGSSRTADVQADAHERGKELDIELRALEQGGSSSREVGLRDEG